MSGAKVELLPCPFCNGAAEFYVRFDSQAIGWSDGLGSPGTHTTRFEGIRCTKCKVRIDTDSKRESVVSAWNLRALSAEVERLERENAGLRDTTSLLSLLADIRRAAGDAGGRLMQAELVQHIARLRDESARLDWLIENVGWREFHAMFDVNAGSYTKDHIRAAIDAARSRNNGQ